MASPLLSQYPNLPTGVLHCNTPDSYGLNIIMLKNQLMSKANENDNLVGESHLAWLFITLITVVILSLVLPFPISLLVSLVVIFSINIIRADIALRKAGMGGIKGYYKSFSSFDSGRGWGTGSSFPYKPLTFSCMRCGNQHNKVACPKCGSKAVRAL